MKHFEDIWEDAEKISLAISLTKQLNTKDYIDRISMLLPKITEAESYSEILFLMCALSAQLNLNVYQLLKSQSQQQKLDMLDND